MGAAINFITALFVFVLIIDPSDVWLRLKLPLFGLLLILCIFAYNNVLKSSISGIFIIYGACILASLIGFFRGININTEFAIGIYKGFLITFLLLWAHELRVLEKMYIPTILIAIIVAFIYIAMLEFPILRMYIYALSIDENSPLPLLISNRKFIGIPVTSVFYKTSPLCLFVLGVAFNNIFSKAANRSRNIILAIGASVVLFCSGTRMNILSLIAMIGFEAIRRLWQSRSSRIFAITSVFVGGVAMLFLITELTNDKGEKSLEIKNALSKAFYNTIYEDPLILIFGNGPGATFDSMGARGTEAVQSELTYQDMIRWFGIPLTVAIMLVFINPLIAILRKRNKLKYSYTIAVAYILYLIVAGTNPLLISSTGMLALLVMYSYAFNSYYENVLQQ